MRSWKWGSSRPLSRLIPTVIAVAAEVVLLPVSGGVLAGATTIGTAGPSGATYGFTVTCATNSATAQLSLRTATQFHAFSIVDDGGHTSGLSYVVDGRPATLAGQDWVASATLQSFGSSYRLVEQDVAGTVTPLVGPIDTTDCPTYPGGGGAAFTAVTPTRVLDTRPDSAIAHAGAKPGVGGTVDLRITGTAGIPTDAVAVAMNVTATEASGPGFVQVFPAGAAVAGGSSNINIDAAGQTAANSVVSRLGTNGTVTVLTSAGAHVVVDVTGYFRATAGAAAAGRFVATTPTRVLDTRPGSAVHHTGEKPGARSTVRVDPVGAARLPAGQVAAVALNVTATDSSAAGFVQVAPAGGLIPGASSTLNLTRAGQTVPNMVIVPVTPAGVDLYTQSGTDLVVDVVGWFTNAAAPASTSGLFVPMPPERVLDTRPDTAVNHLAERRPGNEEIGKPQAGGRVVVYFDGLPADVGSVMVNLTATEASAPGFVQSAARGALVPGASSALNLERAGQTVANSAIVATDGEDAIELYTQSGTHLLADVAGFFRQ